MNAVLASVSKKTVSIPVNNWLVCAIAFSNSKSAGFLNPLKIKLASTFYKKKLLNPHRS